MRVDELKQKLASDMRVERVLEVLERLIAFQSVNPGGKEQDAAHFIADFMRTAGCEVSLQEVEPGRPNVIAVLKGTGQGKSIILNTHIDVVPAGDGWSSDPFKMRVDGDRVVGRGVMDAKGPLAAMMVAIEAIARAGIKLPGDIILAAVVDEEAASLGAKSLPSELTASFAVIGEATNRTLAIAHRGSIRPILAVKGVSAHSSTPQLGKNAVSLMAKAVVALDRFAEEELVHRTHPLTGQSSLAVTIMKGGIKESMIPDYCEALIDRRLIPGESEQEAIEEMMNVLERDPQLAGQVYIERMIPTTGTASETDEQHELVQLGKRVLADVYEKETAITGLTANCDMTHFVAKGIPAVIYGPGDFSIAHKIDEWVTIDELEKAVCVYAYFALEAASQVE
ncbi:M20 family metallopeptidase [Paenibacillus septentrionalis]|uniref:M20 family metallopeptidase n=1 Tax=Paenibacillus septentrionalis TaxID=429342 RepID=A0ABW1V5J7_9BACL